MKYPHIHIFIYKTDMNSILNISIIGILLGFLLISGASAQCDICTNRNCPDGMECSPELQHCVCSNDRDYSGEPIIELPATVFDFQSSNEDFENGQPEPVTVSTTLAYDNNPWFTNADPRFESWYESTPGVNMNTEVILQLIQQDDGSYHFDGMSYFPIDNQLFGNEGFIHNYHFTTKTAWSFDYHGGELLNITFDDGILVYINRQLVINEPGLHYLENRVLYLDQVAAEIGMVPGYTYPIHFFHMERHKWHSQMDIRTDMILHPLTCKKTCVNDEQCGNGVCHPFERICHCQLGWSGDFCDEPVCLNSYCGDNGNCNPYNGKCRCDRGWAGDRCDIKTCNYRGEHENTQCKCDPFYTGDSCESCIEGNSIEKYLCEELDGEWRLIVVLNEDFEERLNHPNCRRPGTGDRNCFCDLSPDWERDDDDEDSHDDGDSHDDDDGDGDSDSHDDGDSHENDKRIIAHLRMTRQFESDQVPDSLYYQRRISNLNSDVVQCGLLGIIDGANTLIPAIGLLIMILALLF
jgi:fibro-slime domain-containing protein